MLWSAGLLSIETPVKDSSTILCLLFYKDKHYNSSTEYRICLNQRINYHCLRHLQNTNVIVSIIASLDCQLFFCLHVKIASSYLPLSFLFLISFACLLITAYHHFPCFPAFYSPVLMTFFIDICSWFLFPVEKPLTLQHFLSAFRLMVTSKSMIFYIVVYNSYRIQQSSFWEQCNQLMFITIQFICRNEYIWTI